VDINGDGTVDVVYAGDLKGNIWKFDLTSANDGDWDTAFGGKPLFTVTDSKGVGLPITAAPIVKANTQAVKGLMVAVGTGRDVTETDRNKLPSGTTPTANQISSFDMDHVFVSVMDRTTYKYRNTTDTSDPNYKKLEVSSTGPAGNGLVSSASKGPATLMKVEMGAAELAVAPRFYQNTEADVIDWDTQNGWYFEFPVDGEQVLKNPSFYDGSNLLDIVSTVPARGNVQSSTVTELGEFCANGATSSDPQQFLTMLDIRTGKPPSLMLFDTNNDGAYTIADGMYNRVNLRSGAILGLNQSTKIHKLMSWNTRGDREGDELQRLRMPTVGLRASWLHLD
jgi:type IV pilus assembly protein PilY1